MTMQHEEEAEGSEVFKVLAPYLAGTVLVAVLAVVLMLRFFGIDHISGANDIVTFDVVKYTNAQRAVASRFLKDSRAQAEAGELLLNLTERTRLAIRDVAGVGTTVLLKQAVVQGQTTDITDEVLRRLGLPVDIPTSDGAAYTLDIAPTMLLEAPQYRPPPAIPGVAPPNNRVLP